MALPPESGRFKPGVSPNPGGRPSLKDLRRRLKRHDRAAGELMAHALAQRGEQLGHAIAALKLFYAYRWGKPPEAHEESSELEAMSNEELKRALWEQLREEYGSGSTQ